MPEMMENPEMFDGEMAFEDRQIGEVLGELEDHHIDEKVIHDVKEKLRMTGATRYEHERFVIKRNLSQGFDIDWKIESKAA